MECEHLMIKEGCACCHAQKWQQKYLAIPFIVFMLLLMFALFKGVV